MNLATTILSGARVLCVDDSPEVLLMLRTILSQSGANVTACASAEEAILNLSNERFDVVISDLSMPPGLDGYDLVHALREMEAQDPTRKATPTIAVSGDALRASGKRRFADFQVYVAKPARALRLVHIIDRLLEAEGDAVKLGSLDIWEADQATMAAETATEVAAAATAAAVESTSAAADATAAAADATAAAADATAAAVRATAASEKGRLAAASAEASAARVSSKASKSRL